jgi:hypothetical protein
MWSAPATSNNFDNRYDVKYLDKNFYSYLLSTILIKKLGYKIELFCDKKTSELYSMIPYDKINIVDFSSDGISSKFWIWGKIKTHSLMNEPYVHIDGDVFLFRDIIKDNIINGKYSVVVQSLENKKIIGEGFNSAYLTSINPFKKNAYGINWDKYGFEAYNCGVIGFSDLKIRDIYYNKVKEILFDLSNNEEFNANRKKYSGMFLISEQSLLLYLLKENNIKPFEILPYDEIIKRNYNWHSIANDIGYSHMWAYSKYRPDVIEKIKFKIYKYFPEYIKIIEKFDLITNNLNVEII